MMHVAKHSCKPDDLITSMSSSKSPTSFACCVFHLWSPPGLRSAFDMANRNEKFSSREKRGVLFCTKDGEGQSKR